MSISVLLSLFILLNIVDLVLTLYAINNGGSEANPLINLLAKITGLTNALIIFKVLTIALAIIFIDHIGYELIWLVWFYICICLWNALQVFRIHRKK